MCYDSVNKNVVNRYVNLSHKIFYIQGTDNGCLVFDGILTQNGTFWVSLSENHSPLRQ